MGKGSANDVQATEPGASGWVGNWLVWLVAVVVVAIGGVVVTGVWLAGREEAPSAATTAEPTPSPTRGPLEEGRWQIHPDSPFPVGMAVWVEDELVVAGERWYESLAPATLAALDPETGVWRSLPDHPADCRALDGAVWTGQELVFVGGYTTSDCVAPPGSLGGEAAESLDSYALDVKSGTWRVLSAPPQPLRVDWALGAPIWTGREVLVFSVPELDGADRPVQMMMFDPDADTWRLGESTPGPARRDFASVWTGQRLLVWGGYHESVTEGEAQSPDAWETEQAGYPNRDQRQRVVHEQEYLADGWAYDPDTDTWSPISLAPISGAAGSYAAWTGDEMIIWGGTTARGHDAAPPQMSLLGAAYTPETDTWRTIADPPADAVGDGQAFAPWLSVWTGTEFIVWSESRPSGSPPADEVPLSVALGAAYNPTTDRWRGLPETPLWHVRGAVWTGRSALLHGWLIGDDELFDPGERLPFSRLVEFLPGPRSA